MKSKSPLLFAWILGKALVLPAATPSTSITSERMEMLRFHDHNEFMFVGDVKIKSKNFSGSCDRMWARTQSIEQSEKDSCQWTWCYGQAWEEKPWKPIYGFQLIESSKKEQTPINQLQLIVASGNVFLETKDAKTGEIKQSRSQRAVIFPKLGKMVLTQQAEVKCSVQGNFRGEKITFYKGSEQVIVENEHQGQRSEVFLGEK